MDQTKIGKFISEMRKQSGATQRELAEKIGISNVFNAYRYGRGWNAVTIVIF